MTLTTERSPLAQRAAAGNATDHAAGTAAAEIGRSASLSAFVLGTIVFITAIAPLATDMYVPAFPLVGRDLAVSATQVQLTLTTFFIGMALGQLIGGPVSDRIGRRRPLLIALTVFAAASVMCAFGPTIAMMLTGRLVQGAAGGWAMVIARSIVIDLTSGARMVRAMNVVAGVAGVAPVVGPLLGAAILQFWHWRVSFWVVGALAVLMLVAVAARVPETLPRAGRHGGGVALLIASTALVVRNRYFVGYLLVFGFSMGAIFAYVATSAFVLQSMNGLSPLLYSVDFACNAVGLTVATLIAARLADKVSTRRVVGVGLATTGIATVVLLVGAFWLGMPLLVALIGFFVLMSAQGLVGPNAGALASSEIPGQPGTGSALLGGLQWCMAGVIAPLAGLGGEHTAVPMAVILVALTAISVYAFYALARPMLTASNPAAASARC